jgi:hypothetical protein
MSDLEDPVQGESSDNCFVAVWPERALAITPCWSVGASAIVGTAEDHPELLGLGDDVADGFDGAGGGGEDDDHRARNG